MAPSPSADEEMLARVRIVRELGARTPPTHLATIDASEGGAASAIDVVLETYANLHPRQMRTIAERGKRMCAVRHPHLVSVLSLDRIGDGISVVTEHVDGVPLEEVFFGMSLGARLRVVVDVLAALSALHATPGGDPIIHGGLLARSAFVEKSGRTKLGFAYRQPLCLRASSHAPEALLGDEGAIDARTDVYGAGVLLWEAITGRALFGADGVDVIVGKQLAGRVAKALPAARDRWARSVLPVIERALAVNPTARFASIAAMAGALRIAVRARLMMHEDVIEELWPADTARKLTSGVQPAAEPLVADAASVNRIAIDTPSTAIETTSSPVVMDPPPVPMLSDVKRPQPSQRARWIVAAIAAALVLVVTVVGFARHRGSKAVAARPDVHEQAPQRPAISHIVPPASAPSASESAPIPDPTATAQPPTPTHKATKHGRPYEPSTI